MSETPKSQPKEQSPQQAKEKSAKPKVKRPALVGIGCSAGGLQALESFFKEMAADSGMSFIVVMHLHPEHPSELASILSRHTKMPVRQVDGRVRLQPDHVYVASPNKLLLVDGAELVDESFEEPRGRRTPIDAFFRSMAECDGNLFGLVLSGGGSDGVIGLRAVKATGGAVLVQEPDEAGFDAMPRHAIQAGLADFVLPVGEIAEKLPGLLAVQRRAPFDPENLEDGDLADLSRILSYLRARLGHDFTRYKRSTMVRRVTRRMHLHRFDNLADYLGYLRKEPDEARELAADLLIVVTSFFRDTDAFHELEEKVIPRLFAGKGEKDQIRVWVAGCASGEEAYSIAMLLSEQAEKHDFPVSRIQVFASDLDERALRIARRGVYPEAIENDVSEARLERFFIEAEGGGYEVKKELRDVPLFAYHDLVRDPPFSRVDLVCCRNVLIYMERELQDQIIAVFRYALKNDGFLFLGGSESVGTHRESFSTVSQKHHIFQVRKHPQDRTPVSASPLSQHATHQPEPMSESSQVVSARVHRELLEDYAPPSALIDRNFKIIHLSDRAGRYLLPQGGPFTNDITKLVRPELRLSLRSSLYQALEKSEQTFTSRIPVKFNGESGVVQLLVQPGRPRKGEHERVALVLFMEQKTNGKAETEEEALSAKEVERLADELRRTQEELQEVRETHEASSEELRSANEELQSINEEYRSTTEELETSKEELQSINEELQTVNAELRDSLDQLSKTHNDLQNLTEGSEIATLFLDREMHIRRFTPSLAKLFNIRHTDLGRPIKDLAHRLRYPELTEDVGKALEGSSTEREVPAANGDCYSVRVNPYRKQDRSVDGAILSFIDISELKLVEAELREAKERAELTVNTVREGLLILDEDLAIESANDSFFDVFGGVRNETVGRKLDEVANGLWNIPELLQKLEALHSKDEPFLDLEIALEIEGKGQRVLTLNARRMERNELILLAIEDVTDRRHAQSLRVMNEVLEALVRERTAEVRELASKLTGAEHDERARIGQILHDDLQQVLYAIHLKVDLWREEENLTPTLARKLDEVDHWIDRALQVTRGLTVQLSPPVLADEGLKQALEWLASHMQELHELDVAVDADQSYQVSPEMHALLFQAVRELLFNVVKHAETEKATVRIRQEGEDLVIIVADQGKGFDPDAVPQDGFGMQNMRRRLQLLGGSVSVVSHPGHGADVTLKVPLGI